MGRWTIGVVSLLVACGSSDGGSRSGGSGGKDPTDSDGGSSTGGTGGRGTGGFTSTGGIESVGGAVGGSGEGGTGGFEDGGAGGVSTGGTSGVICSESVIVPHGLRTQLYLMVDRSSSMADPLPGQTPGTWWSATQQAMTAATTNKALADEYVALQYFPIGDDARYWCGEHYETPDVSPASNSTPAQNVLASLRAHGPVPVMNVGDRPLGRALAGAVAYLKANPVANTDRSVVLITRGLGTDCAGMDAKDITAAAAAAQEAGIGTAVIGIDVTAGADELNAIAKAGGSNRAQLLASTTGNITQQFGQAIERIVAGAPICDFDVPGEVDGRPVGDAPITVTYQSLTSVGEIPVPFVKSAGACASSDGSGWYFDDPAKRTRVTLCPATCDDLAGGTAHVKIGCETPQ